MESTKNDFFPFSSLDFSELKSKARFKFGFVSGLRFGLGLVFLSACILQLLTACNKKESVPKNAQDETINRGKMLYLSNCMACHNSNPNLDGTLGPAIKGSSLELLQARVLRGEYPPGYTPKRPTQIMVKLPLTEANVQDLHAYLNAP
jgi:mono/diheme cytochrome c family protein